MDRIFLADDLFTKAHARYERIIQEGFGLEVELANLEIQMATYLLTRRGFEHD